MIKHVCVHCGKIIRCVEDELDANSGEICPKCLKKHFPDAYWFMKDQGHFTQEQIAQAENL